MYVLAGFLIGSKIRQYGSQALRKIPVFVWLAVDIALFALAQFVSTFDGLIYTAIKLAVDFLLHIVGAAMSFVLLQRVADRIRWSKSKLFQIAGRYSMPVYLFHQQVIYFLIYWLNGLLNPYLHAVLNFAAAMTVSMLVSAILMRMKWSRFLIGEK